MSASFQELAYCETHLGPLSLRRRRLRSLDDLEIYEVKVGEEFLMSSLFTAAEIALARLGLAGLEGNALQVVVGGLGLGYTARAALQNPAVASLLVVDALEAVIAWHRDGVVPLGSEVAGDPRCRLISGDFFKMAQSDNGFDPQQPRRPFDAILLDIDHSPQSLLHPSHEGFYGEAGLRSMTRHLAPGGVFALWADGAPDSAFLSVLGAVFSKATAHVVTFPNPLLECESSSTVYVSQL